MSGRVEDLQGTLLVEATGTFVQPKYAKLLSSAALKQVMGEPTDRPADGENLRVNEGHI